MCSSALNSAGSAGSGEDARCCVTDVWLQPSQLPAWKGEHSPPLRPQWVMGKRVEHSQWGQRSVLGREGTAEFCSSPGLPAGDVAHLMRPASVTVEVCYLTTLCLVSKN